MSSDNSLPTHPVIEVPQTEQPSMSTIPPPSQEKTAQHEVFDSRDNPDVEKQYLSTPISRPRPPRKSRDKLSKQDNTSSARTDDSFNTASESPSESQDGSDVDEEFRRRKKRPHSGVIGISPNLTWDQLANMYVTLVDEHKQLTKLNVNLEKKSEVDTAEIEILQERLNATRTANNAWEPRTLKAEKELANLQDAYHEVLSRNAELEGLNKSFRREATQARNSEEKLRALHQGVVNQLGGLKEALHVKDNFISQLKEDKVVLMKERNALQSKAAGFEHAQQLLAGKDHIIGDLTHENLALRRETEAVQSELEIFKEQEKELAEEIWRYEGGQTVDRIVSDESIQGSWNEMVRSQTCPLQKLVDSPALTNASTHSSPGIVSPQNKTLSKINDFMLNGADLNDVFNSNSGSQEEATDGSPRLQGLGIKLGPSADDLKTLGLGEVSTNTPAAYANGQTQKDIPPNNTTMTDAASQVESPLKDNNTAQKPMYVNTVVQTELDATEGLVEKLPYIDAEVDPSLREVFEMIKPVTVVDEMNTILPPTTYVDANVQPSPTERVEKGAQTDVDGQHQQKLLHPGIYVDAGVQKDSAHVEILRQIISADPTSDLWYASKVRTQGLLNTIPEEQLPSSSEMLREKRTIIFRPPSSSGSKPIYKVFGPCQRDLYNKIGVGEAIIAPEVIQNPVDPVVRDFAFEVSSGGINSSQGPEFSTLPMFPVPSKDQHSKVTASSFCSREEGMNSIGSKDSSLSRTRDFGMQTDPLQDSATASLPAENKQPQTLTFNVSSISSKPLSVGVVPNSTKTFTLPIKGKNGFEERERSSNANVADKVDSISHEEPTRSNKVKKATPWWWYAALSVMIMAMLTHAFFEERRFWRNANELTRHAVIGMRDERWGSDWFDKVGYTLDQKLSIDRTGFC